MKIDLQQESTRIGPAVHDDASNLPGLSSAILVDISEVARVHKAIDAGAHRELVRQKTSEKRVIVKRACLGPRQRIPPRCR